MSRSEHDEVAQAMQEAQHELGRTLKKLRADVAGVLSGIRKSNKELLAAINKNTAAANRILATADKRLAQFEQSVASNDGTAFPADPRVLEEGEFLRTHLTGLLDTERPGPLFKDALKKLADETARLTELEHHLRAKIDAEP
jgi:hypothetical protein